MTQMAPETMKCEPVAQVVPIDGHKPNVPSNRMLTAMRELPQVGTLLYELPAAAQAAGADQIGVDRGAFQSVLSELAEKHGLIHPEGADIDDVAAFAQDLLRIYGAPVVHPSTHA